MRLRDLDAHFIGDVSADEKSYRQLDSVEGAQGVSFQCPKCAVGKQVEEEDGRRFVRGEHRVVCWFANPRNAPRVSDEMRPKPGRWYFKGDTIDTLTFTGPGACSVLLQGGCGWHGFVTNGDAA